MCLGMLFTVLAIKNFVSDSKYKYLKTGIFFITYRTFISGRVKYIPYTCNISNNVKTNKR